MYPERLKIQNIWVDPVNRERAIQRVAGFLHNGKRPHSVFSSNPEKNFSVPRDPVLYEAFENADLLLPDGIGLVLAARILYGVALTRIPGAEFIYDICSLAEKENLGIFVYGAKEEVNKAAVEKLKVRFPKLEIAGRSNGYILEEAMNELVEKINRSQAKILFLALGSPKQEKWFVKYRDSLSYVKVCQGIGGTLDTIAETVKRAPETWQRWNAEWLYRLLSEPSRIRRQKVLPIFAGLIIAAKIRKMMHFDRS